MSLALQVGIGNAKIPGIKCGLKVVATASYGYQLEEPLNPQSQTVLTDEVANNSVIEGV